MKLLKLPSNHEILFYDSINELPICVRNEFNKYLLLDIGIGSGPDSISDHHSKLYNYLTSRDIQNAAIETQNLHFSLFNTIEKFNPKYYSFAVMAAKIDGERVKDYSKEELEQRLGIFSEWGVTHEMVIDIIDNVKKKLIQNYA